MEVAFGVFHLSRRDFYDFSVHEWMAALAGYRLSLGVDSAATPATSGDLKHLARWAAPSRSIRR